MLMKGTAFILSDNYALPLPVGSFIVTIDHPRDFPLTRPIAVECDKPYLSNEIRILCVINEFTAIMSARISLNKIWFLCPVLVYYELATVPKKKYPSSYTPFPSHAHNTA